MLHEKHLPHPTLSTCILYYKRIDSPIPSTHYEETHWNNLTIAKNINQYFSIEFPVNITPCHDAPFYSWKLYSHTTIYTVTFQPGKFHYFYPKPMLDYMNQKTKNTEETNEVIKNLDRFFLQNLQIPKKWNNCLYKSIQIMQKKPHLSIKEVAKTACTCDRHFRRKFFQAFGITPKKFQQYIRFTKIISILNSSDNLRLTDIAYQFGFSDQAHFTKRFKGYTGMTPLAFIKKSRLSNSF